MAARSRSDEKELFKVSKRASMSLKIAGSKSIPSTSLRTGPLMPIGNAVISSGREKSFLSGKIKAPNPPSLERFERLEVLHELRD